VVKDCYADFDRHHIGLVTPSQVSTVHSIIVVTVWGCSFIVASLDPLTLVKMKYPY